MPAIEENKRIAAAFLSALSAADDKLFDIVSDDLEYWIAGNVGLSGTHSKADLMRMLPQVVGLFPQGMRIDPWAMTAEGNRVAVEATGSGVTSSGKVYNNRYHFLFEVNEAGKIKKIREYMDTGHLAETFAG